mgnify:CR=1 FL=1
MVDFRRAAANVDAESENRLDRCRRGTVCDGVAGLESPAGAGWHDALQMQVCCYCNESYERSAHMR